MVTDIYYKDRGLSLYSVVYVGVIGGNLLVLNGDCVAPLLRSIFGDTSSGFNMTFEGDTTLSNSPSSGSDMKALVPDSNILGPNLLARAFSSLIAARRAKIRFRF